LRLCGRNGIYHDLLIAVVVLDNDKHAT
jgi:hypothetical protein